MEWIIKGSAKLHSLVSSSLSRGALSAYPLDRLASGKGISSDARDSMRRDVARRGAARISIHNFRDLRRADAATVKFLLAQTFTVRARGSSFPGLSRRVLRTGLHNTWHGTLARLSSNQRGLQTLSASRCSRISPRRSRLYARVGSMTILRS